VANPLARWFPALFGGGASARGVAKALGAQMDAAPKGAGQSFALTGVWKGIRCRVALDGAADSMTASMTAKARDRPWAMRWVATDEASDLTFVGTRVGLSEADAQRLERLPLKVRLHVIEVVEAGRGSLQLEGGTFTLFVKPAGLARANAPAQAAIRLDVLADLVRAAGGAF
jgi:hypothetical protein